MDVETAHHRHRGEGGEGGALAIPAFPATATGAVAGVELDMDTGGLSIPRLSPLVRSTMVAMGTSPCIRDGIRNARDRQYPRSRSQIMDEN